MHESDLTDDAVKNNSASYSVEDNKLRITIGTYSGRVHRDTWLALKAAGYKATPKQDCNFVATWSVAAEDAAYALIPEDADIEDEDYGPEDRAADRAERFSGYRDKRRAEAHGLADRYDSGEAVYGNQSLARAERQARRRDRVRDHSLSQWSKAEYWQVRTAGVIRHALYLSSPAVRRKRILRLESEQRKHLATMAESEKRFSQWKSVLTMDGADECIVQYEDSRFIGISESTSKAGKLAYALANDGRSLARQPHPDDPEGEYSPYDLLRGAYCSRTGQVLRPCTPREVATRYVGGRDVCFRDGCRAKRWAQHYENRLAYENAMLEAEGGKAADVQMEVGGFVGRYQIHKINKSPATGRVVSVQVWGEFETYEMGNRVTKYMPKTLNIESCGKEVYRAPTPEEREAFKASQQKAKAVIAAKKGASVSLINPTMEDAQRLQDIWNARYKERAEAYNKRQCYEAVTYKPVEVRVMTQAEYSAMSAGTYGRAETISVCVNGIRVADWRDDKKVNNGPVAFKVRKTYGTGNFTHKADAVIVISDKPQKALPLDWEAIANGTAVPQAEQELVAAE